MDPKFIRTFADDISELRKGYRKYSKGEALMSDVIIKLHHIARIVENGEDLGKSSATPRVRPYPSRPEQSGE